MYENVKNYYGDFKLLYLNDNEIEEKTINIDAKSLNIEAPIVKEILTHNENEIFEYNGYFCKIIEKNIKHIYLDKLIDKINEYIKYGFIHMTSYNNLKSIYENKFLYSHNKINLNDIQTNIICNTDIVNKTTGIYNDCVRFYLRDHSPALCKFVKNSNVSKNKLCILVCNSDIINSNLSKYCYLSKYFSATNGNFKSVLDKDILNFLNYDYTFANIDYLNDEKFKYESKPYRNAEFLFNGDFPIEYISKIIFYNHETKNQFLKEFNNWKIECIVDSSMF